MSVTEVFPPIDILSPDGSILNIDSFEEFESILEVRGSEDAYCFE